MLSSTNVDPNGDVLAILLPPPDPFALWNSDEATPATGGEVDDTTPSSEGDAAGNEEVVAGRRSAVSFALKFYINMT